MHNRSRHRVRTSCNRVTHRLRPPSSPFSSPRFSSSGYYPSTSATARELCPDTPTQTPAAVLSTDVHGEADLKTPWLRASPSSLTPPLRSRRSEPVISNARFALTNWRIARRFGCFRFVTISSTLIVSTLGFTPTRLVRFADSI